MRQEFSQKLKNVKSQVEQDLFNAAPIAKQVPVAKEAQQLPVSNNNKKDGVREAAVATEPFIAPTVTALNLKVGLSHVSLQVTLTSMRYPVVLFVPLFPLLGKYAFEEHFWGKGGRDGVTCA